jgi:hypothetical protein
MTVNVVIGSDAKSRAGWPAAERAVARIAAYPVVTQCT